MAHTPPVAKVDITYRAKEVRALLCTLVATNRQLVTLKEMYGRDKFC
eukprot:CAMPEP_0204350208 /NCGR_PEP_ID=MMETSP0469-20131031/30150_1 /ASSEMBLY_ACC=CAM_ASM_000384 /TAXON_ID=2969 /ORGANISM="Oxyrrhis marina" /LENGTH=46 /DNA_ID= /DNA_START= /DNA_END= /DNA_ORIENTATION=